jgi:hypothetical protein
MNEASRQHMLRAQAKLEAAHEQLKITEHPDEIKIESAEMQGHMQELQAKWPADIDVSKWEAVFNPVRDLLRL